MSLSNTTVKATYQGNGSNRVFAIPFAVIEADSTETKVYIRDETDPDNPTEVLKTEGALQDYTLTGASPPGTPFDTDVTFNVGKAPTANQKVIVIRQLALTNDLDQSVGVTPSPVAQETAINRLTALIQQMQERLDRSPHLRITEQFGSMEIPEPVGGYVLGFKDDLSGLDLFESNEDGVTAAAASAAAAAASATAAQTAETNAETAETNAETAETNAEAAATQAADSAAEAAASAALLASVWSTGDVKVTLKALADSGWVMMDDGSIGNAASAGTTRANADCEALFTLLWNNISDTYAPVSGGRGASAAADFAANKRITLPKALGRALAVAGSGSTLTARALGEVLGAETHTLVTGEMPSHTHVQDAHTHTQNAHTHTQDAHTHTQNAHSHGTNPFQYLGSGGNLNSPFGVGTEVVAQASANTTAVNQNTTATNQNTTATNQNTTAVNQSTGGGGAHNNMQPTSFFNIMIKL